MMPGVGVFGQQPAWCMYPFVPFRRCDERVYPGAMLIKYAVGTAVAGLLMASGVPSSARELPPRSITHQNSQYWTWAGPRNWVSADGAYGITISSGNGQMTLDYGFSSIVCASAATAQGSVTAYFGQQLATLRQSLRANWRRVRVRASAIGQLPESAYGPLYFQQRAQISGVANGTPMRGVVSYDYSLASGPTYCYSRSVSRVVPAQDGRRSLRQLQSVQASLAYFGPGAPLDPVE